METPAPVQATRELTQHHDGGLNDHVALLAYPEVGKSTTQYSWAVKGQAGSIHPLQLAAAGEAGLTNEVLLAILVDRLSEAPNCKHHTKALGHVEDALVWLQAHAQANRPQAQ